MRFVTDTRHRLHKKYPRCPMCGIRLTDRGSYCSTVCTQSHDAEYRRDMERTVFR